MPLKKWLPPNASLAVVLHPDAVEVVCGESGKEESSKELFYIDRGDRVEARVVRYLETGGENNGPVVVLGTSQGRVHILRRGGALPAAGSLERASAWEALSRLLGPFCCARCCARAGKLARERTVPAHEKRASELRPSERASGAANGAARDLRTGHPPRG